MVESNSVSLKLAAAVQGQVEGARGIGELQRWADATDDVEETLEAGGHKEGSWDQFQANKKLGVTTSYREDIYTTQLDRTKMSKEQQARAAELERQINQRESRGAQPSSSARSTNA